MPAVSTAGAVHLVRLLHRDPIASVYTGTLGDSRTPVVVTLANQRVDGSAREVFLDWGAKLTHLSAHPHIAPVAAIGLTSTACPYVAVLATRSTLADVLRESGPPPAGQVRALGVALADTLATIHQTGMIHGALQPATVLSGPGRKLLVAGFDATAPVLAHPLPPSPYTAPEHLDAAKAGLVYASPAADVYNLATLLYAALGGRLPWVTPERANAVNPLLRAAPVPDIAGVSVTLTDVLGKAMSAEPRMRPDAAGLRDLLSNVDTSRPLAPGFGPTSVCVDLVPRSGPRPTPLPGGADVALPPNRRNRNRNRWRIGAGAKLSIAAVAAFVAIGGAGMVTFAATHAEADTACPTDTEIAQLIDHTYDGATVSGRRCSDEGYVAVLASKAVGADESKARSADDLLRLAVHRDGDTLSVLDGCATEVPKPLRDYLDC
jgi:serine/threonine protein kinase